MNQIDKEDFGQIISLIKKYILNRHSKNADVALIGLENILKNSSSAITEIENFISENTDSEIEDYVKRNNELEKDLISTKTKYYDLILSIPEKYLSKEEEKTKSIIEEVNNKYKI